MESSSRDRAVHPLLVKETQKGVRLTGKEDAVYCEVARRLKLSSHRGRDGFAVLARRALAWYLCYYPEHERHRRQKDREEALDMIESILAEGEALSTRTI